MMDAMTKDIMQTVLADKEFIHRGKSAFVGQDKKSGGTLEAKEEWNTAIKNNKSIRQKPILSVHCLQCKPAIESTSSGQEQTFSFCKIDNYIAVLRHKDGKMEDFEKIRNAHRIISKTNATLLVYKIHTPRNSKIGKTSLQNEKKRND